MDIISQEVKDFLLYAEAKALATSCKDDINVVPVSSIKIVENEIWLIDYFFNKTRNNIKNNPTVSLTAWTGLRGYQVKATANYVLKGKKYEIAKNWISNIHPNRIIYGVILLKPTKIFDISIHNKQL